MAVTDGKTGIVIADIEAGRRAIQGVVAVAETENEEDGGMSAREIRGMGMVGEEEIEMVRVREGVGGIIGREIETVEPRGREMVVGKGIGTIEREMAGERAATDQESDRGIE